LSSSTLAISVRRLAVLLYQRIGPLTAARRGLRIVGAADHG
jgi:hypothetical protein